MRYLQKMAILNLARHKKRTFITASAIAYGIIMFIIMRSILIGIDTESMTNLKLYETATGRIMAPGYWDDKEDMPLSKSFDPKIVAKALSQSDAAWSPRIGFGGQMIFAQDPFFEDGSLPGRFTAIDPMKDGDVFRIQDSLSEGRWLNEGKPELVMGYWLAEDIGAKLGSFVTVQTETKDGAIQVFDLQIVGILNCANPEVTRSGLYLPLKVADDYLEMNGRVTEVNVNYGMDKVADQKFAAIVPAIEKLGLEAIDWRTLGADFVAISQSKQSSSGMMIMIILIIAGVGISNTMLMAIYERVRELGMMRALGMKNLQVRSLFLWESAGIGLLGSTIGVVFGASINWFLVKFGIDYSFLLRENNFGYRIQGQMFGVWDIPSFLMAFVLGLGMAVLVAVASTNRVLRLDIPASLRFQ